MATPPLRVDLRPPAFDPRMPDASPTRTMNRAGRVRRIGALLAALCCAQLVSAADLSSRPAGKFLFQPQFLWANLESTVQGTGYLIGYAGKFYGVTSIHFLDFDVGGMLGATWLDLHSDEPVTVFRASLGRPARTSITRPADVAYDFLLMPGAGLPEGCSALQLEQVERYPPGARLWFPNKNSEKETGYEWVEAAVVEDLGYLIKVRFLAEVTLESQSGSPMVSQATGKVVGMLTDGEEKNGKLTLNLCPARSLLKRLKQAPRLESLMVSIRRK